MSMGIVKAGNDRRGAEIVDGLLRVEFRVAPIHDPAVRNVDQVAFVRFASVYRRFEEPAEFIQEVNKLEESHDSATP